MRTTVNNSMRVAWTTVGDITQRVVKRQRVKRTRWALQKNP